MIRESAPPEKRRFYASPSQIGVINGFVLSAAIFFIVQMLPKGASMNCAWRVPFLVSILICGVGIYIRSKLTESAEFATARAAGKNAPMPVLDVIREHPREILQAMELRVTQNGGAYIMLGFVLAYGRFNGVSSPVMLGGVVALMSIEFVVMLLRGRLSDRIGRTPVYLIGALGLVAVALPLFLPIDSALNWLALLLGNAICHGAMVVTRSGVKRELFSTEVRNVGVAPGRVVQEDDRLQRAAEAAEIGTFYYPLPLQRIHWNARCKTHFWLDPGTPDDEVDIDTFYRTIHPDDRSRVRSAVDNSIADGKPYDVEHRTLSTTGEIRWLRAKGSPSFDDGGRVASLDGITIDISEQKRLETERDALIESEQARRRAAQSANQAKDAFIAAVSHELRAPLTAILAWVELLAQGDVDPGCVRNGVSVIRRNVVTQTRLVNDLLDASRISKGKFLVERTPIAVADCLSAALQEVRPIADKKGVFVGTLAGDEVHVLGDGPRLQQVFSNLLSNALKHTGLGGKIVPSLVVTGNIVRICVADTGAGIPPERLDDIFEPFVQVESAINRERAGLGLGLAIARSIVVMHGGEIFAQSSGLGQGSTFTVVLPTMSRRSLVAPAHEHAVAEPEIGGRSVLLIEDDADTLEALALTLQFEHMHVQTAKSADEAREALKRHLPDIIVSDLTMPGEHGCDFIQSVRGQCINVPAVALTGSVRIEDEQMALNAGFNDYVRKPVEPAELIRVIGKLIRQ